MIIEVLLLLCSVLEHLKVALAGSPVSNVSHKVPTLYHSLQYD